MQLKTFLTKKDSQYNLDIQNNFMKKKIVSHIKNRGFDKKEAYEAITGILIELEKIDNLNFGTWYKLGNSLKEALEKKVEVSKNEIEKNITTSNNDLPDISTYDLSLWNGNSESKRQGGISFRIKKSQKSQTPSSFVYSTPLTEEYQKQLDKNLNKIIDVIVKYLNPDFIKYGDEIVWEK